MMLMRDLALTATVDVAVVVSRMIKCKEMLVTVKNSNQV